MMNDIIRWFSDTPWITRYAWFTHRINPDSEWEKFQDSYLRLQAYIPNWVKTYAGF